MREKLARSDQPYVLLKAAATLDGKIATRHGESQWITGEAARAHGHGLRGVCDGILVGVGTVRADDPRLTCRPELEETRPEATRGEQPSRQEEKHQTKIAAAGESAVHAPQSPTRIVLDSRAGISPQARCLADDGVPRIVVVGEGAPANNLTALKDLGVTVIVCAEERPQPESFLPQLRNQGIQSLLVEGGATVHGSFIARRAADELFLYLAGGVLGDAHAPGWCVGADIANLADSVKIALNPPMMIDEDILIHGFFG